MLQVAPLQWSTTNTLTELLHVGLELGIGTCLWVVVLKVGG